jgi:hypothetical protein
MNRSKVRALAGRLARCQMHLVGDLAAGEKITRRELKGCRAHAIRSTVLALIRAEPSRAEQIVREGVSELERVGCDPLTLLPLTAELAAYDLNKAMQLLPHPVSRLDWRQISRDLARKDLSLVRRVAAAVKRRSKTPLLDDYGWLAAAYKRCTEDPLGAWELARKHIKCADHRAGVLGRAVAVLARSDPLAAQRAIRAERDPGVRVRGWIVIARKSRGRQRLNALRRAERALQEMGPGDSRRERFHRAQLWALLTLLAGRGPLARRYLDGLRQAMSRPPTEAELAAVLAVATYADPTVALSVYQRLKKRADKTRWFDPAWHVLDRVAPFLARVDPEGAAAVVAQRADRRNETWSLASCYADLAEGMLDLGARTQARAMFERAEKAIRSELRAAARKPKDEIAQWRKREAVDDIARALVRLGQPERALNLIARHADPVQALKWYLDFMTHADGEASQGRNAFQTLDDALIELEDFVRSPGFYKSLYASRRRRAKPPASRRP